MCDCSEQNNELEDRIDRLEGQVTAILDQMKMYASYTPEKYTLIKMEEPIAGSSDAPMKVR